MPIIGGAVGDAAGIVRDGAVTEGIGTPGETDGVAVELPTVAPVTVDGTAAPGGLHCSEQENAHRL